MEARLFHRFRNIAYEKAGIDLKDGKEALVAARVGKRIRKLGLKNESAYLDLLESDATGEELVQFLDAISTNFTSFFRERDHFEFLALRIREWFQQGQTRFRIWSAASSSGEEPYSIAITVNEAVDRKPVDFKLLATDISTKVLTKAKEGVYEGKVLQPVPKSLKLRYFDRLSKRGADESEEVFRVRPEIKRDVVFKRLNLSTPPVPVNGPLDFVFCRNVMIYFDKMVRQNLVSEIERVLRPDGYLLIGHTETLTGLATGLRALRPSVYQKRL